MYKSVKRSYYLYLHLSLSTSLPEHMVASATLMENTRIFPELSLQIPTRERKGTGDGLVYS